MNRAPRRLAPLALATVCLLVGASAGCSSKGGDSSRRASTYAVWDPYSQFDSSSPWGRLVDSCGRQAGVTIRRTTYAGADMATMVEVAAPQSAQPDLLVVDNAAVAPLASKKLLTTAAENQLNTSAVEPNLLAAGQDDGTTFGLPIGANTLALYYNKPVLKAAGVHITSITDWDSLPRALQQVTDSGRTGITFAGVSSEEGSYQFLPWFWGAGADLRTLDSPQAVEALSLLTVW